jgi:hypothetical protein
MVYDVSGRLAFSKLNNMLTVDKISTFNLAHLMTGDYVIKIKTKNMEKSVKWVKE